jgi:hypothetical protein
MVSKTEGPCDHWVLKLFLSSGHVVALLVEALWYKPEGHGYDPQQGQWIFSIYQILPAALGPGVYLASNRNEYKKQKQKFLGTRAQLELKADNPTAICEPTVYTMWDPQHLTIL